MNRIFEIGDRVICKESGVVGLVLRFYTPTSCEEQTLVKTDDGREYHAPTRTWIKTTEAGNITIKLPILTDNKQLEWHRENISPNKIDLATNRKGRTVIFVGGRGSGKSYIMETIKNIPGITFEEACKMMSDASDKLNKKEVKRNE